MGHFLADQRYGVNSSAASEQTDGNGFGIFYNPNGTNHPHIDVLENFIPTLDSDHLRWIPKGLMEDLIDNGEPVQFTQVNDLVSGFTIQQIFAALQSDVTTVPAYKARLIQQNTGNQTTAITNLFASYAY